MKFRYIYRDSAGKRLEGRIEAPTREDAFSELRKQKIKAIKVVSLSGSKANGEEKIIILRKRFVFAALVIGVIAGIAAAVYYRTADFRPKRIIDLETKAMEIVEHHRAMVATLHLGAKEDFKAVLDASQPFLTDQRLGLGRIELGDTKMELKDLFIKVRHEITDEKELAELERVYDKVMDAVNLIEAKIENDARAFSLLEKNRDKWRVENGRIIWSDDALALEFSRSSRLLNN